MASLNILTIGLLIGVFVYLADCEVCYRRYVARRDGCKRPMKRQFDSSESCCGHKKAAGYAVRKTRNGKVFECTPCGSDTADEVDRFVAAVGRAQLEARPKRADSMKNMRTTPKPRNMLKKKELGKRKNGGWTEWSVWSQCSKTCMAGIQERIRLCPDGGCKGPHKEARPCSARAYCPVDGRWGPWYPWETCTHTCAGGVQIRKRQCNNPPPLHGGRDCQGNSTETRQCGGQKCPVHGEWASWSSYSECSVTCGKGIKVRMRECTNPPPSYGGKWCKGKSIQQKKCHLRMCPIQGGWSLWSSWSHPSISCGEAVSVRRRECDSPSPQFGGKPCDGDTIEFKSYVHKYDCPVDGGWTDWTSFGTCSAVPCQRGFQLRSRSCTNPKPKNGGRYCVGRPLERQECINHEQCHKVEGGWCEWSTWGPCSLTCGTSEDLSFKKRIRECACPAPKNGGHDCNGERFQTEDCTMKSCPPTAPIELDMPVLQNPKSVNDEDEQAPETAADETKPDVELGSGAELTTTGNPSGKPTCGVTGSGDSDGSDVACDQEAEEDEGE